MGTKYTREKDKANRGQELGSVARRTVLGLILSIPQIEKRKKLIISVITLNINDTNTQLKARILRLNTCPQCSEGEIIYHIDITPNKIIYIIMKVDSRVEGTNRSPSPIKGIL